MADETNAADELALLRAQLLIVQEALERIGSGGPASASDGAATMSGKRRSRRGPTRVGFAPIQEETADDGAGISGELSAIAREHELDVIAVADEDGVLVGAVGGVNAAETIGAYSVLMRGFLHGVDELPDFGTDDLLTIESSGDKVLHGACFEFEDEAFALCTESASRLPAETVKTIVARVRAAFGPEEESSG